MSYKKYTSNELPFLKERIMKSLPTQISNLRIRWKQQWYDEDETTLYLNIPYSYKQRLWNREVKTLNDFIVITGEELYELTKIK